ncbi:MAG: hypothetical protein KDD44_08000 [Bdellovibrionales bacterium]|nr:hypothetical protein [Bdellovibrionales bacterium]
MTRHFISWLCIFAYSLAPTGPAAELVLCHGDDGHVRIEAAQNGSCERVAYGETAKQRSATLAAVHNHCGPCDDSPINLSYLVQPKRDSESTSSFISAWDAPFQRIMPNLPLFVPRREDRHPQLHQPASHLYRLRSVVLVI